MITGLARVPNDLVHKVADLAHAMIDSWHEITHPARMSSNRRKKAMRWGVVYLYEPGAGGGGTIRPNS